MTREGSQGGYPDFDHVQAEFGDRRLQPALPGTLEDIQEGIREIAALAHRHPIAELAVMDGDYLVHIKKHLELEWTDTYGDTMDFPRGEISVYEGSFDGKVETYTVWPGGEVCQRDGRRFPFRVLEPEEAEILAAQLLYALGEEAPENYAEEGSMIEMLFDVTAAKGARAYEVGDSLLIGGRGPDLTGLGPNNGEINFDIVEREKVLPELAAAPKIMFDIKMETPHGTKEYDQLTILENGVARYKFDNYGGDQPAPAGGSVSETPEEKAARRQENQLWQQIAREAGLDLMTEEQAQRVTRRLMLALPRIKWQVAYPDQAG